MSHLRSRLWLAACNQARYGTSGSMKASSSSSGMNRGKSSAQTPEVLVTVPVNLQVTRKPIGKPSGFVIVEHGRERGAGDTRELFFILDR